MIILLSEIPITTFSLALRVTIFFVQVKAEIIWRAEVELIASMEKEAMIFYISRMETISSLNITMVV